MKSAFSTTWKSSTQPRKQRKYRYNAPLHIKQKMLHTHLSPTLRKKYETRNTQIKKGDKIKILRGQFSKKEGKVNRVDLKNEKVFVDGIEIAKKDGPKIPFPLRSSNLMIVELDLSDKKRKQKLEKSFVGKTTNESKGVDVKKEEQKVEEKKEVSKDKSNENHEGNKQ
jgi:large subunit ribosomal protein L24